LGLLHAFRAAIPGPRVTVTNGFHPPRGRMDVILGARRPRSSLNADPFGQSGEGSTCRALSVHPGWTFLWRGRDLNPRPSDYEPLALPLSYLAISSRLPAGERAKWYYAVGLLSTKSVYNNSPLVVLRRRASAAPRCDEHMVSADYAAQSPRFVRGACGVDCRAAPPVYALRCRAGARVVGGATAANRARGTKNASLSGNKEQQ
jgi:hypothetical protein